MGLGETSTVDWVLPAMLAGVWLLLWLAGHRVRVWFLAIGVVVSILCIPAGFVAARLAAHDPTCTPDSLCVSPQPVYWWLNGFFGLASCLVLAVLTAVVEACWHWYGEPDAGRCRRDVLAPDRLGSRR